MPSPIVGGANPSLVEALGAGSAVTAHRNKFNWSTAGAEQFFFSSEDELDALMTQLTEDPEAVARARAEFLSKERGSQ
jgi:hypothetical protein